MSAVELIDAGHEFSITVKEHTDPKMCAAISCLLYTAAGYITNEDDIIIQAIVLQPGDSKLVWAGNTKARWLFDLLEIGFRQLEAGEPENIFIKFSKNA